MSAAPTVLTGAVRSGCTHLTTTALLTAEEAAALARPAGSAGALARLLRAWQGAGAGGQPWRLPGELPLLRVVAQADSSSAALLLQPLEAAAEGGGALATPPGGAVCAVSLGGAAGERQRRLALALAGPAATTVGAAAGTFRLQCADWQELVVGGGAGVRRVLHCRSRGRHLAVSLLQPADSELSSCDEASADLLSVPEGDCSGSEGGSQSEAEAAEEARWAAALQAGGAAEAWVPAAERRWGLFEFELAAGAPGDELVPTPPCCTLQLAAVCCSARARGHPQRPDCLHPTPCPASPALHGTPRCRPACPALPPSPGVGPLMGAAVPVLVLPDGWEAAAAELCQLQQAEAAGALRPGYTARVLQLANLVLLHLEQQREEPTRATALPPAALQRLAAAARWLCALCLRCRWPALLRRLLPATTAGGESAAQAAEALDSMLTPVGALGMATAAGSAPLLLALTAWAEAEGYRWQAEPADGSGGLTPLHLAAAQGPALSLQAAAALVGALGPLAAARSWRTARAGGWTPRQVARVARCATLAELLEPIATPTASPQPTAELVASGSGGGGLATEARSAKPAAEAETGGEAPAAEAELLLREQLELELGRKKDAGDSDSSGADGLGLGLGCRLPATPAELAAWQRRPLSPTVLAAVAAAAVLIVVGLSAALRAGLY